MQFLSQKCGAEVLQKQAYGVLDELMGGLMDSLMDWCKDEGMDGWTNGYSYGYCNGYVSTIQLLFPLMQHMHCSSKSIVKEIRMSVLWLESGLTWKYSLSLGKSLRPRLYFPVYHSSCHNTDSVYLREPHSRARAGALQVGLLHRTVSLKFRAVCTALSIINIPVSV